MRSAWMVCLIAGCGFTGPGLPTGDDPGGAGVDGGGTASANCDAHGTGIKLCLSFEGNTVHDLAVPSHPPAIAQGLISILRLASHAATLDGNSRIRFDESHDFDVPDLTVGLWAYPDHGRQSGSFTLLDNHVQYTLSYEQDQHIQCVIGGQSVRSDNPLPDGWHHVACRYNAGKKDLRVFVDGDTAGCGQGPGPIPAGGRAGVAVGASFDGTSFQNNFIGSLDTVHLYATALSDMAICNDAGKSSCSNNSCSDGDGGGGGHGR